MRSFILMVTVLLALPSWGGGFTVRNGGGLAEFNFEYGFRQLDGLVRICKQSMACRLTPDEVRVAQRFPTLTNQQLVFVNDAEFGKTEASSVTGGILKFRAPSDILVNLQALYPNDEAIGSLQAIQWMLEFKARVLGSHDAPAFAQKILSMAQATDASLSLKDFGYFNNGLSFLRLHDEVLFTFQDDVTSQNLRPELEHQLECPGAPASAHLISIENLTWGDREVISASRVRMSSKGHVRYECLGSGKRIAYGADLETFLEVRILKGSAQDFMNGASHVLFELTKAHFEISLISTEN